MGDERDLTVASDRVGLEGDRIVQRDAAIYRIDGRHGGDRDGVAQGARDSPSHDERSGTVRCVHVGSLDDADVGSVIHQGVARLRLGSRLAVARAHDGRSIRARWKLCRDAVTAGGRRGARRIGEVVSKRAAIARDESTDCLRAHPFDRRCRIDARHVRPVVVVDRELDRHRVAPESGDRVGGSGRGAHASPAERRSRRRRRPVRSTCRRRRAARWPPLRRAAETRRALPGCRACRPPSRTPDAPPPGRRRRRAAASRRLRGRSACRVLRSHGRGRRRRGTRRAWAAVCRVRAVHARQAATTPRCGRSRACSRGTPASHRAPRAWRTSPRPRVAGRWCERRRRWRGASSGRAGRRSGRRRAGARA